MKRKVAKKEMKVAIRTRTARTIIAGRGQGAPNCSGGGEFRHLEGSHFLRVASSSKRRQRRIVRKMMPCRTMKAINAMRRNRGGAKIRNGTASSTINMPMVESLWNQSGR